jgi:hypothetical protein
VTPWGTHNIQLQNSILFAFGRHISSLLNGQSIWFSITICTCLSPSCNMSSLKTFRSLASFQNNEVWHLHPYSISNSLHSYYCRKTQHTVDSYPNFFRTTEHRLSAKPQESNLLSRLSIGLRVISRTEVPLGIQGFMQPFPELRNNLGSSIADTSHLETSWKQTVLELYNSASSGPL